MKKDQTSFNLLERVLKFISLRPRSQKEILDYLQKKVPQKKDLQEKIFKEIENLNLVDDKTFADWWIEQRNTFRPKGKKALFYELRQKGVAEEIIQQVLAQKINEVNLAKQLVNKKWLSLKKLPFQIAQKKLISFLSQRGFSWITIKKILDEIKKKQ